jgi:hypothetical protein
VEWSHVCLIIRIIIISIKMFGINDRLKNFDANVWIAIYTIGIVYLWMNLGNLKSFSLG